MKKKLFSILLSLCMVLTLIPSMAGVAQADTSTRYALRFSTRADLAGLTSNNLVQDEDELGIKFPDLTEDALDMEGYFYVAKLEKNVADNCWEYAKFEKLGTGETPVPAYSGSNNNLVFAGDNNSNLALKVTQTEQGTNGGPDKYKLAYTYSADEYNKINRDGDIGYEIILMSDATSKTFAERDGIQVNSLWLAATKLEYENRLVLSTRTDLADLKTEGIKSIQDSHGNLGLLDFNLMTFTQEDREFKAVPYIANCAWDRSNHRWVYKSFSKLSTTQNLQPTYLSEFDESENKTTFTASKEGVWTIDKLTSGDLYTFKYTYNEEEYNKMAEARSGQKCYAIWVNDTNKSNNPIQPVEFYFTFDDGIAPVNREDTYSLRYDMKTDPADYQNPDGTPANLGGADTLRSQGQGEYMEFTDAMIDSTTKTAYWYTTFYVTSGSTGGRDARGTSEYYTEGGREIRTYIGSENDFVIKARHYSENDENTNPWITLTGTGASTTEEAKKINEVFKIEYIGSMKGTMPVFKVTYDSSKDLAYTADGITNRNYRATNEYEFVIEYTGNDQYLSSGNENNVKKVWVGYSDDSADFSFDQYFLDDEGEWATGNMQYFDKVGETLITKMIIRPAADYLNGKPVYYSGEEYYTYIEGAKEIQNFKFYYRYRAANGEYVEEEVTNSPFTIEWNSTEGYYEITYDKPANDVHGPDYILKYVNENWKNKLTGEKYNAWKAKSDLSLHDESYVWTNKLTTYVSGLEVNDENKNDATRYAYAWSDGELIDVTEVVFNKGAVDAEVKGDIQIKTDQGTALLSGDLVTNIKSANESNSVSFTAQDLQAETNGLTAAQEDKVDADTTVAAVDLSITSNGTSVGFGNDGKAEVTVKVSDNSLSNSTLTVYYVDNNGNMTKVSDAPVVDGKVTFTTDHFSTYIVSTDSSLETKKSSYSGGGSAGGSVSTTDNVTNTAENKATETAATTTATVKAETKTDSTGAKTTTATVDSTTASKIVEKAVENKSEEVVVDTSSQAAVTETAAGAKTEVAIPAETVAQISEKTDAAVIIKSDAADVTLDKEAVAAVAEQAGSTGDVKLIVETVAQTENKVQVELKLESSNGTISDFKGGNVSVTVKLGKTLAAKKLICVYIDDNGTYHKVSGQLNADGTYTFKTTHFSSYAIMAEEDADAIIAEQIANVEKMVGKLSLKARSSKTSKGNIKVKVITDADDIKALEDLGYTVKYKFYRSTKKASGYKAKFETSGKTYTNTTGKKGMRYYYKARVMVYDAQGTLIAKSALKQCKYACRTK